MKDIWGRPVELPPIPECKGAINTSITNEECPTCKSRLCIRQAEIEDEQRGYESAWLMKKLGA